MKLIHFTVVFAIIIVGFLLIVHFTSHQVIYHSSESQLTHDQYDVPALLELIKVQNETIHTFEIHLKHSIASKGEKSIQDAKLIEISDTVARLSRENEENRHKAENCHKFSEQLEHNFDVELQKMKVSVLSHEHCPEPEQHNVPVVATDKTAIVSSHSVWPTSQLEDECEARYGLELVDRWRKNEEIWCESQSEEAEERSELKCYPYHQSHKKLDGRPADLICEATNFVIDFNKVVYITPYFSIIVTISNNICCYCYYCMWVSAGVGVRRNREVREAPQGLGVSALQRGLAAVFLQKHS